MKTVVIDRLGLRWEPEKIGNIDVEYAYSADLMVGAVQRRTDSGRWVYRIEAVHTRWIVKGRGEVRDKAGAKRALRRIWRIWLQHSGLAPVIKIKRAA